MKLFRGIAVPRDKARPIIANIRSNGLASSEGTWKMVHEHPGDLGALHVKPDLTVTDTHPGTREVSAACACGDKAGALYYAHSHNRTAKNDTPIIIEFLAEPSNSAIDGKDFLYTAFQLGDPERARLFLERCFGSAILKYADRAWSSEDQSYRIAQCDLAIHDPDVVQAHHANPLVLAGRHRTVFRSAFTIALPVGPAAIIDVSTPTEPSLLPHPDVRLREILLHK